MIDDAKPVTEEEIADVLRSADDVWTCKISAAIDLVRRLAAERDRLYAELDPAVCRLQFPDGAVPGNAREAAEGWHYWAAVFRQRANDLEAERDRLKSLVVDFMDYEPCQYDHHGLCQAHTLHERPCPYEVAQKLFPKETQ